ncbi:hypothetical protein EON64_03545 [archaeon]|nr:MAG: hypothetical protein EON64_03545 [archaeon]
MHLLNSLLWRSALKSFHPIAPSLVNIQPILECIRWAPSSNGVSPYDIHVVTDDSLKKALREASFDQPQVSNHAYVHPCSAYTYIVFAPVTASYHSISNPCLHLTHSRDPYAAHNSHIPPYTCLYTCPYLCPFTYTHCVGDGVLALADLLCT